MTTTCWYGELFPFMLLEKLQPFIFVQEKYVKDGRRHNSQPL